MTLHPFDITSIGKYAFNPPLGKDNLSHKQPFCQDANLLKKKETD
jgi:hypothetical protein